MLLVTGQAGTGLSPRRPGPGDRVVVRAREFSLDAELARAAQPGAPRWPPALVRRDLVRAAAGEFQALDPLTGW